jgi:hypothetical protein
MSEDLNLIRGNHQLSIGTTWIHSQLNSLGNFSRNGNFTFAGTVTGNALADFMVGRPSQFSQNNGQIGADPLNIPSAYVQDNIRINPRLTMNIGLRWDPYLLPYQNENHVSIFDMDWYNQTCVAAVSKRARRHLFDGDGNARPFVCVLELEILSSLRPAYDPRGKGLETIVLGGIFQGITPLFLQGGDARAVERQSAFRRWRVVFPILIRTPGGNPYPLPSNLLKTTTFPQFGGGLGYFKLHPEPTHMQQWSPAPQSSCLRLAGLCQLFG